VSAHDAIGLAVTNQGFTVTQRDEGKVIGWDRCSGDKEGCNKRGSFD
jgi:hypothetical protein